MTPALWTNESKSTSPVEEEEVARGETLPVLTVDTAAERRVALGLAAVEVRWRVTIFTCCGGGGGGCSITTVVVPSPASVSAPTWLSSRKITLFCPSTVK